MREDADWITEGVYCERCGEYIGDEVGHPRTCDDCHHELHELWIAETVEEQK